MCSDGNEENAPEEVAAQTKVATKEDNEIN